MNQANNYSYCCSCVVKPKRSQPLLSHTIKRNTDSCVANASEFNVRPRFAIASSLVGTSKQQWESALVLRKIHRMIRSSSRGPRNQNSYTMGSSRWVFVGAAFERMYPLDEPMNFEVELKTGSKSTCITGPPVCMSFESLRVISVLTLLVSHFCFSGSLHRDHPSSQLFCYRSINCFIQVLMAGMATHSMIYTKKQKSRYVVCPAYVVQVLRAGVC
jgi:hypothetical protein